MVKVKGKYTMTLKCLYHVRYLWYSESDYWFQLPPHFIFFFSRPLLPTPVFPFQCRGL
jgi:hypothetical protein